MCVLDWLELICFFLRLDSGFVPKYLREVKLNEGQTILPFQSEGIKFGIAHRGRFLIGKKIKTDKGFSGNEQTFGVTPKPAEKGCPLYYDIFSVQFSCGISKNH